MQLDTLEWSENDSSSFAFLDQALEGKRIVFLGESDHFVAERMPARCFRGKWTACSSRRLPTVLAYGMLIRRGM